MRIPSPGAPHGSRLFVLEPDGSINAIRATHTVLARELHGVHVGQRVTIASCS